MLTGVVAGFGDALGQATHTELESMRAQIVRMDIPAYHEVATTEIVQEFVGRPHTLLARLPNLGMLDAAFQLLSVTRNAGLPDDQLLIECGNELDLERLHGLYNSPWASRPDRYAQELLRIYEMLRLRGFQGAIISGGVSTLQRRGLIFLAGMGWAERPSDIIVGVHHYQPMMEFSPAPLSAVRRLIGKRNLAMTEGGYTTGPVTHRSMWGKKTTIRRSDEFVCAQMVRELDYWAAQPDVVCYCWYQLNDGTSASDLDHYGLRYVGGEWKPQAYTLREWITSAAPTTPPLTHTRP